MCIRDSVPGDENEEEVLTMEKVRKLFTALDLHLSDCDILRAHRLPSRKPRPGETDRVKTTGPPAIIVKLLKYPVKRAVISASINKKPTTSIFGVHSQETRIYLNEQLIRETQLLFNRARNALIKEPVQGTKYHSVSHRDGIIRAKKTSGSRPVKIVNAEDLDRLVADMKSVAVTPRASVVRNNAFQ